MNTLIIPCAGRNFINNQPKWSLKCSNNEYLLSKCIKALSIENFDRIIVTLLIEDLKYCSIKELKRTIPSMVEFFLLEKQTLGPAETVYKTIIDKKVNGQIFIKDIDIIFPFPFSKGNFISGIHLLNYESDLTNVRNKSFITRNEKDVVMDIIEKNVKSDIISIGLYGFADSLDFIQSYEILLKSFPNEKLYVSHIITYLIGVESRIFNYVEIESYELFETDKDYDRSLRNNGVYIIDGTKINIEKYISEFEKMSKKGALVLIVQNKELDTKIENILRQSQIKYKSIICQNSDYIKLINNEVDIRDIYLYAV